MKEQKIPGAAAPAPDAEDIRGSIWTRGCPIRLREPLEGDLETEVAVIGAGMAGLLIAHALQEAGHRVVVLEADRIASGQTRRTTAKITSQHGLVYETLVRGMGEELAGQYAMANEAAVAEFRRLITAEGIDCAWEEKDAYVYGADEAALRREAETAARLGLPAAFTRQVGVPVPAAGAVRFSHQAQFDPLRFLRTLSDGLTVYEKTPVRAVHGRTLRTARGEVRARHIVFACHYPFVNVPGWYFLRMHQERSYVLALENASLPDGMYIGTGSGTFSFRGHHGLLLLGGGGHRAGDDPAGGKYDLLRRKAAAWYPGSREIARWSAQDCVTADGVPYIGRFAPCRPYWYVATGFGKWGMTSSMAAALLLRDLIGGREHPYAQVFRPDRLGRTALAGMGNELVHAVRGIGRRFFLVPRQAAEALPAGQGGVVLYHGKKAGAYREDAGMLRAVDIRCPHLGCQLEWNPDEKSWDCPCHGSRFDPEGRLLSNPAQRDLRQK